MSPRRRSDNKDGDSKGKGKHERPRKAISSSKEIAATSVTSSSKQTNLLQVCLRFKKVDYFSVTPLTFNGDKLSISFIIKDFDLDFLKFPSKAVIFYYGDDNREKVGKVMKYSAVLEDNLLNLQIALANVIDKSVWDREFFTDEYFYNEYVIGLNKFWHAGGDELERLVRPLGLCKKSYEDDTMFKRRIVNYIQATIKPTVNVMDMLNADLNNPSKLKE